MKNKEDTSKMFVVRTDVVLHTRVKTVCAQKGVMIKDYLRKALEAALKLDEEG